MKTIVREKYASRPITITVSGPQGSGKSTIIAAIERAIRKIAPAGTRIIEKQTAGATTV